MLKGESTIIQVSSSMATILSGLEKKAKVLLIVFITITSFSLFCVLLFVAFWVYRSAFVITGDELAREEENQAYLELDLDEQELFFQSRDFLASNPYIKGDLTLSQNLSIQEKGIKSWEFLKDPMLTNNDLMILNRYELNFFKKFECSAQTNLPIPLKNEVYYFESKIYSLPNPEGTTISVGLSIKPYPWFRLPGRHAFSVCYDSDGHRRHNQPFNFQCPGPFPPVIEGDVIGVGYRTRSGTVFFTRNGKKLSELKIGGHVKNFKPPQNGQLFPIIGANNLCSVHVNIGQMGYVFIEGNVKKWGFAPLEGNGPAPPAYRKFNMDILLERSEVDEANDLGERENDFPPDFWDLPDNNGGTSGDENYKFSYDPSNETHSDDERITMDSLIPEDPPNYTPEVDAQAAIEDDVDDVNQTNTTESNS